MPMPTRKYLQIRLLLMRSSDSASASPHLNRQPNGSSSREGNHSLRKIRRSLFILRISILQESPMTPSGQQIRPMRIQKHILMSRISKLIGEDEKLRGALDLVILLAPEEVEQRWTTLSARLNRLAIISKDPARYQPPGIPAPSPDP